MGNNNFKKNLILKKPAKTVKKEKTLKPLKIVNSEPKELVDDVLRGEIYSYIPRVFHSIPWNTSKNIAKYYNDFMELIDINDWACFLDGDAVHTTTFFGKRIENIIVENPKYSLFTCYTNRIGRQYQIAPNVNSSNNDQKYHREFGEKIWNHNGTKVIDITELDFLSGVLILLNKKTWLTMGKITEGAMLGIDNQIHKKVKKIGGRVGLMSGIYVQHWYRGGKKDKSHLL